MMLMNRFTKFWFAGLTLVFYFLLPELGYDTSFAQTEIAASDDLNYKKACKILDDGSPNLDEAITLLKASEKSGNLNAASKLGQIYFAKNNWFYNIISIQHLSKGLKNNHAESCIALANFYLSRKRPKTEKALELLKRADIHENGLAKANLAKFYGSDTFGARNEELSLEYYIAGSKLNDKTCLYEYGKVLFNQSEKTALDGIKKIITSANLNHKEANSFLVSLSDSLCNLAESPFMDNYDSIILLIESDIGSKSKLLDKLALSMIRLNDNRLEITLSTLSESGHKISFDLCKEVIESKVELNNKEVMLNCYLKKIESGDINAICGYLLGFSNGDFDSIESNHVDICLSSGDDCCFPEFEDTKKSLSKTLIYKLNELTGTESTDRIEQGNDIFNKITINESTIDRCVYILRKLNKYNSSSLLKTLFYTYLMNDASTINESDLTEIASTVSRSKKSDYNKTRDSILNEVMQTNRILIKRELNSPYIWDNASDSNLKFNYTINSKTFDRSLRVLRFFSGEVDSIDLVLSKLYLAKGILNCSERSLCEEYLNTSYYYANQDSSFLFCETYAVLAALHSIDNSPYHNTYKARDYILKMEGGMCDSIVKNFFKASISSSTEEQLTSKDVSYLEKSANSGDVDSALKLGDIYSNESGANYDLTKALHVYEKIEKKSGIACYKIAIIHRHFNNPTNLVLEYLYTAQNLGFDADDLMSLISELENGMDPDALQEAAHRGLERANP